MPLPRSAPDLVIGGVHGGSLPGIPVSTMGEDADDVETQPAAEAAREPATDGATPLRRPPESTSTRTCTDPAFAPSAAASARAPASESTPTRSRPTRADRAAIRAAFGPCAISG